MARTLPWATNKTGSKASTQTNATTHVLPRKHRASSTTSDGSEYATRSHQTGKVNGSRPKAPRLSRTPSTSPPPAPPAQAFMLEGIEADDRYMMVEDEFLSVAQAFTQHLHHAEYKRLKEIAKHRKTSSKFEISNSMRPELKKKLEGAALHNKQSMAVKTTTNASAGDDEDDVEADYNPWNGSSLGGLMTAGSRKKVALVGLEKIPSASRAAGGFERQLGEDSRRAKGSRNILDVSPERYSKPAPIRQEIKDYAAEPKDSYPARTNTEPRRLETSSESPLEGADLQTSKTALIKPRRKAVFNDGWGVDGAADVSSFPRIQDTDSSSSKAKTTNSSKAAKSKYSDIPIFLA